VHATGKERYSAMVRWLINHMAPWPSVRVKISDWKRRLVWHWTRLKRPRNSLLFYTCNICGKKTWYPRAKMGREVPSCMHCGSTVRLRSVINALSNELFGESLLLSDFPRRPDLIGVGLTDWERYAGLLATKLSYTNTYYHKEPFLDITSVDPIQYGRYDFLISSDVFEHISPPIQRAFENARRLLKPGGVMIFSVPCVAGPTKEHFPELNDFSIVKKGNSWVLRNRTLDGREQEFPDPTFHGGPGTVVEMRLFGKDSLQTDFKEAGFASARLYGEEYPKYGIVWLPYDAEEAPYRPPIYGLDAPPWALRSVSSNAEELDGKVQGKLQQGNEDFGRESEFIHSEHLPLKEDGR